MSKSAVKFLVSRILNSIFLKKQVREKVRISTSAESYKHLAPSVTII